VPPSCPSPFLTLHLTFSHTFLHQSIQTFNLGSPETIFQSSGGNPNSVTRCTLIYNSYSIPDRFVLRAVSPCGAFVADTSYTGNWRSGCGAGLAPGGSAPCCAPTPANPACAGSSASPYCPRTSSLLPGEVQTNSNGFLPGPGKLSFPVGGSGAAPNQQLFLSVFGECGGTGNTFAMICCANPDPDGHCPGTGTPGNLLYLPNGTGCVVEGKPPQITRGNTPQDTAACMQCTLN
jgi:hypothetical protein